MGRFAVDHLVTAVIPDSSCSRCTLAIFIFSAHDFVLAFTIVRAAFLPLQ